MFQGVLDRELSCSFRIKKAGYETLLSVWANTIRGLKNEAKISGDDDWASSSLIQFLAWILRCDFSMRWKKLKGVLRVCISIKHKDSIEMEVAMTFFLLDYALIDLL